MSRALPFPVLASAAIAVSVLAFVLVVASALASPAPFSGATDKDCGDFRNQRKAQTFFLDHDPNQDPHGLDGGDHDGVACEGLPCPCRASAVQLDRFDNGSWLIKHGDGTGIPEEPFRVKIDGASIGRTRLLALSNHIGSRFPQVLVIASSGYLRLVSGADATPAVRFGQSLVLGPAIYGTSASFPDTTLFSNPQVGQVSVDTSGLAADGSGPLLIRVVARDKNLEAGAVHSNQLMNLTWEITLGEPTETRTRIEVNGRFTFTERVTPDPSRTAQFESFRLLQISSMFIDAERHDVDGFRYRDASGPVEVTYSPTQTGSLLPASPSALASNASILDSFHTDDLGQPNGNTPSYRITTGATSGPVSGPLTPRAFLTPTQDLNDDNLGLWIHQKPADVISAGRRGKIRFNVVATADPLPAP